MSRAATAASGDPIQRAFAADVVKGLSRPQKAIPSRWLYDARGSELFEEITGLAEYYPTRTETAILEEFAADMAGLIGSGAVIVEYGAGAARKTRILIDALDRPAAYVPIDISAEFLRESAAALRAAYPWLTVVPRAADFLASGAAAHLPRGAGRRLGFFPGSTIGNLPDMEIVAFLSRARAELGSDAFFLLGVDIVRDPEILIPAYDDARGVTAAFNLNLLARINRELEGTFALDGFAHEARWNGPSSRVEMHLVSRGDQAAAVLDRLFRFRPGETIHTENSRKFSLAELQDLARRGGWDVQRSWTDSEKRFCVALLSGD